MDIEFKNLLRKYASTGDPEYAIKIANMILRYEDKAKTTIWVTLACYDQSTIDDVGIFFTEEEAMKDIARKQLSNIEQLGPEFNIIAIAALLSTAEDLYNQGNYKELNNLFDDNFGRDIWFEYKAVDL